MARRRDIRQQRREHQEQRWQPWQQERDDDLRDDEVPNQDDDPASWERSMQ